MANQIDCDVFVRRNALKNPISYVQGTDLLPIIMHFLDFEIPSGATANVFVLKSDKTAIYGTATINGNDVTIDVDAQMFMAVGLALLQVEIIANNETLVSFAQPVNVEPNLKSGDFPPSETQVLWIDEAIKQAQEAVSDANQALEDANTAITGANNAAAAANEAAENAEKDVQDYLQQNPVNEAVNDYMTAHPVEVTPEVTDHVMTFSEGSQTGTVVENDYAAYTHTEDGDYPLRDLDAQNKIKALAPAIIEKASGTNLLLTDSAEQAVQGLKIYGQSTQEKTTGAQLFDGQLESGTYSSNTGEKLSNSSITRSANYIYIPDGAEKIIISPSNDAIFYFYDSDYLYLGYVQSSNPTVIEGAKYITFRQMTTDVNIKYMLNSGSTALPWEPYTGGAPSPSPDYPQEIVSKAEDGQVEVEVLGGNLYSEGDKENLSNVGFQSDFIPWVKKPIIYLYADVLSDNPNGNVFVGINYYNDQKEQVGSNGYLLQAGESYSKGSLSISGGSVDLEKVSYIKVQFSPSSPTTLASVKNIVVTGEENLEFTGYYTPQTLTVSTHNGLPGIPVTSGGNYTDETGQQWVCDEVDFKRGVYVQRVKKASNITWHIHTGYVVDGTELFNTYDITDGINLGGNNAAFCSKLRRYHQVVTINETGFYQAYGSAFARIKGVSDTDEFNQLMSGAEILYQLQTPLETPLSPTELSAYAGLHTNYPTTTVQNDDGCYMEMEYAADTETYIANNYVDKAAYNALEDRVAALEGAAVANV